MLEGDEGGKRGSEKNEKGTKDEETRPRGQRCVLGLKRDIVKKESLILTDRPTDGYILS